MCARARRPTGTPHATCTRTLRHHMIVAAPARRTNASKHAPLPPEAAAKTRCPAPPPRPLPLARLLLGGPRVLVLVRRCALLVRCGGGTAHARAGRFTCVRARAHTYTHTHTHTRGHNVHSFAFRSRSDQSSPSSSSSSADSSEISSSSTMSLASLCATAARRRLVGIARPAGPRTRAAHIIVRFFLIRLLVLLCSRV